MRRLAVLVAAPLLVVVLGPVWAAWAAASPVTYTPPVDAAITDPFRPPAERWLAGNRGIDYDTEPGRVVAAAADGEVVFAGQVGGQQHVVVLHADGVRTSYSFLRSTSVRRGDRVTQGQPVGTAGESMHFGARIGDAYVDPTMLLGDGLPQVYLVPDGDRAPGTEGQERAGLLRQLGNAIVDGGKAVAGWTSDHAGGVLEEVRGIGHYAIEGQPLTHALRIAGAAREWAAQRGDCTPGNVAAPKLGQRHIAVLVGGLGSSSDDGKASIAGVDTAALGFAPADVLRFSYRGGQVRSSAYGPTDTTVDIRQSARRLRDLLDATAEANPGVPIDVLAHSEGGLVARSALAYEYDPGWPVRQVASLVTLASPHQGTDIATAGVMLGRSQLGDVVEKGISLVAPFDLQGSSVGQMAETSSFIAGLGRRPVPPEINVTSIGGRWDFIVPSGHTELAEARNVVVSPSGLVDHSHLPGSPQAQREIALALAGMAPTCQSFGDAMLDAVVSDRIAGFEDRLGAGLWLAGHRFSSPKPGPRPG